ncbi:hypothetical protein LINGRAPRIM_LOCUS2713 [Linum grandiflorum]
MQRTLKTPLELCRERMMMYVPFLVLKVVVLEARKLSEMMKTILVQVRGRRRIK